MSKHPKLSRRQALTHLSAGSLLALGLWPGCASPKAKSGEAGPFRFLVANDTHYMSEECGQWLAGVVRQMRSEQADFCILAGDLVEQGRREHLAAAREIFQGLDMPVYPVIGNHDYLAQTDRRAYVSLFPKRLNYCFRHRGWQFIGLDTSDGVRYEKTAILPATFQALDEIVKHLDPQLPTVMFTHFPLAEGVKYCPANAGQLLERLRDINLQAVLCGHFHGDTERVWRQAVISTSRCCALKRGNHDKSKEKGYVVCTASEGRIRRRFVECKTPPVSKDGVVG